MEDDTLSALSKSLKKSVLHPLAKISAALRREDQVRPKPSPQFCETPSFKAGFQVDRVSTGKRSVGSQYPFCEFALEIRSPGRADEGNETSLGLAGERVTAKQDESFVSNHQAHHPSRIAIGYDPVIELSAW
jgi:hypothetical protein